jgi:hypothetical protein
MKTLCFLTFLILGQNLQARLFLDVSLVNKKGIDIGLTLGSELHSSEEVEHGRPITLKLKSGVQVTMKALFGDVQKGLIGPPHFILVSGEVRSNEGNIIPQFLNKPIVIALGETKELSHSLKDQSIDIKITPYIQ